MIRTTSSARNHLPAGLSLAGGPSEEKEERMPQGDWSTPEVFHRSIQRYIDAHPTFQAELRAHIATTGARDVAMTIAQMLDFWEWSRARGDIAAEKAQRRSAETRQIADAEHNQRSHP